MSRHARHPGGGTAHDDLDDSEEETDTEDVSLTESEEWEGRMDGALPDELLCSLLAGDKRFRLIEITCASWEEACPTILRVSKVPVMTAATKAPAIDNTSWEDLMIRESTSAIGRLHALQALRLPSRFLMEDAVIPSSIYHLDLTLGGYDLPGYPGAYTGLGTLTLRKMQFRRLGVASPMVFTRSKELNL